jgi:hypothetical protein
VVNSAAHGGEEGSVTRATTYDAKSVLEATSLTQLSQAMARHGAGEEGESDATRTNVL